jgi:pimeloyl-ACP methyl ester carboxylesterase
MIRSWLILLVLTTRICAFANSQFPAGKLIEKVVCKSDASQSYALYISTKARNAPLPIIYFFDPHGDGTLPLKKYRSLADAYGYILAGSNNSKNGNDWATTENIWRHLSGDTKTRLMINETRIYTCGFSGGAKAAGLIALQHPGIKGLIAGGAGLPDGAPAGDFNFSFTAIAGEGDMNLTDLVAIDGDLARTRTRHRIIIFDGKHEWAPESVMNLAFAGLQFDAMRDGTIAKDNAFISRYIANSKARLNNYHNAHQLMKAVQECRLSISLLDGLAAEASWFQQQAASIGNDPQYQQQLRSQQSQLLKEQNTKAEYMQHFQQEDRSYWTTTIHQLQVKAAAKTPERGMYQRLLAYLSLAFYSFSNRLISNNENEGARYFTELYKTADPTNSEAWYFSAILHVREKNAQAAEHDLEKAVQCGFNDKIRLVQQSEFKTLDLSKVTTAIQQATAR